MEHFWQLFFIFAIGIPFVSLFFLVPIALVFTNHQRKMEELRQKRESMMTQDVLKEFDAVRAELRELRDLTTQYDLSFDTTLHQIERRVSGLERRAMQPSVQEAPQNVTLGGRA